jgi:carboxyl-terminal processing protease
MRGRAKESNRRFNAKRGEMLAGVPVVVLIDGGSASCSEVVAGALQDRRRAVVLGMTSFGKGSVQTLMPLRAGREGALRLTTARYYTPAGRSIQETGIVPDREVSAVRVDPTKKPVGMSETVYRNAIRNEKGEARRGAHVPDDMPPEGWDKEKDYQLEQALKLLRDGEVPRILREEEAPPPAPVQAAVPGATPPAGR